MTNPTSSPGERQTRPFADVLRDLRKGRTHDELSYHLQDLVTAVEDTGKPGTLTLKITLKPAGDMVAVTDDITVKAPQRDRSASLFFPDADGNLSRHNPDQLPLPLAAVPAPTGDASTTEASNR